MSKELPVQYTLRLHLTNVAGTGAIQLLLSLLPSLERSTKVFISEIYLPDRGVLAKYQSIQQATISKVYHRWLPNVLSRFLECIVFARMFDGNIPLLVFGDIPLRCNAPQTVFVQTSHLLKPKKVNWSIEGLKFFILRQIFRFNSRFASAFIVQTSFMQESLATSYPLIANKIHIIAQPPPSWLLDSIAHTNFIPKNKLKLIYPSAGYPHKNHKLLANIKPEMIDVWPIETLKVTLPLEHNLARHVPWIQSVGFLSPLEMIKSYEEVDGLLFLSTSESYGFPLVEAMFMGLPIICPDLPYAHALCAEDAIYFDPYSIDSLLEAVLQLQARLISGWRPNWTKQLIAIPKSWDAVADSMINVACQLQ